MSKDFPLIPLTFSYAVVGIEIILRAALSRIDQSSSNLLHRGSMAPNTDTLQKWNKMKRM